MKISAITTNYRTINHNRVTRSTNTPTFQAYPPTKPPKSGIIYFSEKYFDPRKRKTDISKIKEMKVPNFRVVTPTCASGGTFNDRPLKDLQELRKIGITTVVDFRGEAGSYIVQQCKKAKLNYIQFNLNNVLNLSNPEYFIHKNNERTEITDKFVEKLKKFFKLVNKGNVYMGCQYGIDRTNMALTLNYLLNPDCDNPPEILTWPYERKKTVANRNIKAVKKIVKRLNEEQKKQLNITENYNEFLKERIYQLLAKNNLI